MRFYTKQVAAKIGVTPMTIYRWLKAGKIPEPPRDRNGWRIWGKKELKIVEEYATRSLPPVQYSQQPRGRKSGG